MHQRTLLNTIFLAIPMMFAPLALAAASAPAATPSQQSMAAEEHAGMASLPAQRGGV